MRTKNIKKKNNSPPVGFEPTTFWLTARRYNHLATEALLKFLAICMFILCMDSEIGLQTFFIFHYSENNQWLWTQINCTSSTTYPHDKRSQNCPTCNPKPRQNRLEPIRRWTHHIFNVTWKSSDTIEPWDCNGFKETNPQKR